ncbi:isochorismatase family cysteine hydrolase [Chloroflexus sp. MS-CIW-1]|uniref:cysteine hydrolase family protein n=1 Tax=Chloroflexus sp. MS-CIW-1 TaxID=3055768 RepID=UPI0026474AB8|nr:isochorismatase family cysteine hydrolase [Chloroflexus sp. MS-CIW-1]MDN5273952.1 isochorismatase family cysteine hydrolase [Chloroflexus sp. MS-CIW-1]
MTAIKDLATRSTSFLTYLEEWYHNLPQVDLATIVDKAPERVALCSIDMINGFCKEGPLAGPRVGALIEPVVRLFNRAYELGVRAFVLTQDTHDPNTPEFAAYPPHCLAGTAESQTIRELAELPFADQIVVIEKNSLSSHLGTRFGAWLSEHPQIDTFVLVGDCTDLCVYSAAMHLRLEANALNLKRRVIVAANAVDTFDTPVATARELGIYAHDGDLHHVLFLHHMAQNGIEVMNIV